MCDLTLELFSSQEAALRVHLLALLRLRRQSALHPLRPLPRLHMLLHRPWPLLSRAEACCQVSDHRLFWRPADLTALFAGLGATIAQGFAFGTGSAIARNVVDNVMGGGGSAAAPAPAAPQAAAPAAPMAPHVPAGPCAMDHKTFMECLQQNPSDASSCDFYYNALQACQSRQ